MRLARLVTLVTLCAPIAQTVLAQETATSDIISIELNAAETKEGSCLVTFLVTNGFAMTLDKVVYETVLFDQEGQVNRLTLFDFGALPPARPRVRQFAVPDLTCDAIGRVLINGASTCSGVQTDAAVCDASLVTSSRTGIEVVN